MNTNISTIRSSSNRVGTTTQDQDAGDQKRRNAGMLERARCTGSAPHRRGACGSAEEGVPVGRAARKRAENLDECGEGLQLGKRVRNGGVARVACQLDEEGDLRAAPWRRAVTIALSLLSALIAVFLKQAGPAAPQAAAGSRPAG